MPKVSICLPNYNYGKYIGETIRSILNQTYKDFEFIIVDDASTDDSVDVIYSFDDPRIQVYENEKNVGITANWNRCMEYTTGDYIAICHSDDIYHPEIIEEEVNVLSHFEDIHIVGTKATKDIQMFRDDNEYKYIVYTPFEFMQFLFAGNTLVCPSVMIKRKCYEEIGCYNEDFVYVEDQEFYLRAALNCGFAKIDNVLVFYRQQEDKSYESSFEDDIQKHKRRIDEIMRLKTIAKTVSKAFHEEIDDYYLNFIATQNTYLSERYKMMEEKEKADFCLASAKTLQSRIKRLVPKPDSDVIGGQEGGDKNSGK